MPLKTKFAYVGTDRSGAVTALVRDLDNDATARAVAELITGGLLVQRLPIDLARQAYTAGGGRDA